ncbi:MAG: hypothetical protein KDJ36_08165 [Hyphomicrobiaceae bacterium]|nr:hypothetical protein [Hyphomicrobiaceae bacterium]
MCFFKKIREQFARDKRGTVAIVFALTLTIAVLVVGGAVDYGRALKQKTSIQAILDASLSAGAKSLADTGNAATAQSRAVEYFTQLAAKNGIQVAGQQGGQGVATATPNNTVTVTITANASTGQLTGTAKVNVTAPFLGVAGIETLPVATESVAALAGKELELSLMLDITGSMDSRYNGSRKIDDLKFAANDLIDIFRSNLSVGATRIALVPFSESVNVGQSLAPLVRGNLSSTKVISYRSGRRTRTTTYRLTNCVSERIGGFAYRPDAPGSGLYVGAVYTSNGSCNPSQQIVPLTTNETTLRNVVNGLQTGGGTAGHIGTAWAGYLINHRWSHLLPLSSQPKAPNAQKLIKATILMTDGDYNTQYCNDVKDSDSKIGCNSPNGSSQTQAQQLCEAMKADGVVIYTVGFGIYPNSAQERLLKDCASDSSKHFFPYNGEQLRTAFREIGRQLAAGQAGVVLKK